MSCSTDDGRVARHYPRERYRRGRTGRLEAAVGKRQWFESHLSANLQLLSRKDLGRSPVWFASAKTDTRQRSKLR